MTAISGGNVYNDGGSTVSARGVCWGTSPNPVITGPHTIDGNGTGVFTSNLSALAPGTLYYVRAYATNNSATSYGNELTFTTINVCPGIPSINYGGQTYNTVQIGTQCWLHENLNIGIRIDGTQDQTNNGIIQKYCYNDNVAYCDIYGGLYQWNEMMQYSTIEGSQGICPTGWHVPDATEWGILALYLGGNDSAGAKMKEPGLTHWMSPNYGATNSSQFTSLPAGGSSSPGSYNSMAYSADCWSSTVLSNSKANSIYMCTYWTIIESHFDNQTNGSSVRCLKNCDLPLPPVSGLHAPSPTQIIWNWNIVTDATGYRWNTTNNYSTALDMGSGTSKSEASLNCNTLYTRYVWAYNACGHSTPAILIHTTSACYCTQPIMDSRDGKSYPVILIGTQCWMAQNLNLGTRINGTLSQLNNNIIEKYCSNDLESNCDIYGGLYQWNEVMNYTGTSITNPSNRQGICPAGWHLPSDAEWCQMGTYLDATIDCNAIGGTGIDAGGLMKESGTAHWVNPNTGATNASGFTALPGGTMYYGSGYFNLTTDGFFWSASEDVSTTAFSRVLFSGSAQEGRYTEDKTDGLSCRCVKDCDVPSPPSQGINISLPTQIIWNWSTVPDASGYKWNSINNYNSAIDLGTNISKTETGLDCNTAFTRYVWSYNDCDHSTVTLLSQATSGCWSCGQTMTDTRDNKVYNTVEIGAQCWFAQNLNVGFIIDSTHYQADNGQIEKYCYRDLVSNCDVYGGLYQWEEMMKYTSSSNSNPSERQGICPGGWHIPSKAEFNQMIDLLGSWNVAGGMMKETGFSHWLSPNGGATNSSGFTAYGGGGLMGPWGYYHSLGEYAYFWTSVDDINENGINAFLFYEQPWVGFDPNFKFYSHSIRCIKDDCESYTNVGISINPSANQVCEGIPVIFTATPTNGGTTPSYQWKVNGMRKGDDSPTFIYSPENNDEVICYLTSNALCQPGIPVPSNPIIMVVDPLLPVSLSISVSENPFCIGNSVLFTTTASNGGSAPLYQWKVNGAGVGTNSPSYSYFPAPGDMVTCNLNSSELCVSGNPAQSNTITMVVSTTLPAGVSIVADKNPICTGSIVTFTATPVNGGTAPLFQWKVNGIGVGPNAPVYNYTPTVGDVVQCILTSNLFCVSNSPALSNTITILAAPPPDVTFTPCFDMITSINAKPIKLKGGIPLGGVYSGLGVISGYFYPNLAGTGTKIIAYTYTNAALCSASATVTIVTHNASPFTCGTSLTDIRDNKTYPTIQIGSQCWFAANLNYGIMIPSSSHQRDNCVNEKYCYNDLAANCGLQTYYQWDEVMQYSDVPGDKGLCPPGWHIPTETEWNTLFAYYTSNGLAGSPLKYSGYSGFDGLLNGVNHFNLQWDFNDFATFFWSSTACGPYKAWSHGMNIYNPSVSSYPGSRINALSVRCLHD